jgi:hypothetical protein
MMGGSQMPTYGNVPLNVNEVYDPKTGSWTAKTPLPLPVYGQASAVLNNKIYVISGKTYNAISNLVQIYDPATDMWSFGKNIPTAVWFAAAGATTGTSAPKRIYVMGGTIQGSRSPYPTCNLNQVYDAETDTWSSGTQLPTSRSQLGVAVVDDKLYAVGGYEIEPPNGVKVHSVNEQYTPFGFGTVPPPDTTSPTISIASPENKTYAVNNVSLTFTVSEATSWTVYSLDGQANVTITGNTTLTGLPDGLHSLIFYAKDAAENTGTSEIIYFSIKTQTETQLSAPFPPTWVVAATAVIAVGGAAITLGAVTHRRKRSASSKTT